MCKADICFLKGYGTELFFIIIGFLEDTKKTLGYVSLFKLDLTRIKMEEIEGVKDWDLTNITMSGMQEERIDELLKVLLSTGDMWEEMDDLKDAIFFVDLARDYSIFYIASIASELGGYIHIRSEMGKIIYSYDMNDNSISLSSMPSLVLPTSHVSLLECRLKDDREETKCTIAIKLEEEKEHQIVVRSSTNDESYLLNLPFHILEMIMNRCVGVEYMNFRATSKRCHLAAPLIKWRHKAALNRLQTYSVVSPWLMVVDEKKGIVTFNDPMLGDKYFMRNLEVPIVDGKIRSFGYGWLLFYSDLGLVFYNPFTSDIRKHPDPECFRFVSMCFSAPPTSPDCMVVGFAPGDVTHAYILHYVEQDPSWRMVRLDFSDVDPYSLRFPTIYGQDLYGLCNEGDLIVFKDLGEDYSRGQVVARAPISCCRSSTQCFLTKCDQHLLLVIVDEFGESVEVFKPNDSTKEWEEIGDLGKNMIYISKNTCLCIEAKTREMENKIYFPRLHSKNRKVVFYSLETHMYHTSGGKNVEENSRDFVGTIHHNFYPHAWIEPNWS